MSYIIIEVANTHGGDLGYVHELLDTFSHYQSNYGIKFQPLHPDMLATPDFEWHPVYQKLYFTSSEWSEILQSASETKHVWLDLFDEYGVQILRENMDVVYGIKLQVSVLFNLKVRQELSQIDLKGKKMILNVAALEMPEIAKILKDFESQLNPDEILLEVGFQGYPTELQDAGVAKIIAVKNAFQKRIVFADHVEGTSEYAVWLPIIALANGADVIEKHVMLETKKTEYDFYSSIGISSFERMAKLVYEYGDLMAASFINERERLYLERSIMKPVLKYSLEKGKGLSLERDFEFRRSGKHGINARQVQKLLSDRHLLSNQKQAGDTIQEMDLKKATIAVIVACRLKSSRLKEKALLPIGDLPSVAYCLRNACRFEQINHVILATSSLESDAPLAHHTYSEQVVFHTGDPEDVMQRYLDVCRKLKIDIVVRVTADMPFIDNEICQILLDAHFASGADYTAAKDAAVGTNLEIMNVAALEQIKSYFPNATYSEYMTWYFMNNQEHFHVNLVELPAELIRGYRLTLDYDEDLQMFNRVHEALTKDKPSFSIRDVFQFLDQHPEIASMNSHITLKYRTDQALIDTLNEKTKIHRQVFPS